jgi:membrane associated rhomboid family serine protease
MPLKRLPLVTGALVAANTLIFFLVDYGHETSAIHTYGLRPCDVTGGCSWAELPWSVALITSLFTHVSFDHLILNMLFLCVFGVHVEERLGHLRFFTLYFLCGLIATFTQLILTTGEADLSHRWIVGASASIAGVLGAYFLLFPGSKILLWAYIFVFRIRAAYFLAYWLTIQLIYSGLLLYAGQPANVAWIAHATGALLGITLCAHLVEDGQVREELSAQTDQIKADMTQVEEPPISPGPPL